MARGRKTTVVTEEVPVNPEDAPMTVAYRVGRLEKGQEHGFKGLKDYAKENFNKLSEDIRDLKEGFATKEELESEVDKAKLIHDDFDRRLKKIEHWLDLVARVILVAFLVALLALVGIKLTGVAL